MNWIKQPRYLLKVSAISVVIFVLIGTVALCWHDPGQYVFYLWLAQQYKNEYKQLLAQTLSEMPVYPGAERVHVYEYEGLEPSLELSIVTPMLYAYYGIEERIPENDVLSYFGLQLDRDGWLPEYTAMPFRFVEGKRCASISIYYREDYDNLVKQNPLHPEMPYIPLTHREELEQYGTIYRFWIRTDADIIENPLWVMMDPAVVGYKQCYVSTEPRESYYDKILVTPTMH